MANETVLTLVGNLTADPELRVTAGGASVASFTIASTPRTYNRQSGEWEDGQPLFMRCSAWRDLAEHVSRSLAKGMRVVAVGTISQHTYQAQDGTNRTVIDMTVQEIGPSLRYATAAVARQQTARGFQPSYGRQQDPEPSQPAAGAFQADGLPDDDPWAVPAEPSEPEF